MKTNFKKILSTVLIILILAVSMVAFADEVYPDPKTSGIAPPIEPIIIELLDK